MLMTSKTSGTHRWYFVTGETKELEWLARRLHVPVKQDGRGMHLDLTKHKARLALRYTREEIPCTSQHRRSLSCSP